MSSIGDAIPVIGGRKSLLPSGLTTVGVVAVATPTEYVSDTLASGLNNDVFNISGPGELTFLNIKTSGISETPVLLLTIDGIEYEFTVPAGSTSTRTLVANHLSGASHTPSIKFHTSLKLSVDCTACTLNTYVAYKYYDQ